jgi:hypothetical protein
MSTQLYAERASCSAHQVSFGCDVPGKDLNTDSRTGSTLASAHFNVIVRAASLGLTTCVNMRRPSMSMRTFQGTHLRRPAHDFNVRFGRIAYDRPGVGLEPVPLEVKVDIRVGTVATFRPRA